MIILFLLRALSCMTRTPTNQHRQAAYTTPALAIRQRCSTTGKVLIVGTAEDEVSLPVELYDPSTGTFSDVSSAINGGGQSATLLPGGDVLVAGGGYTWYTTAQSVAQVFDPVVNAFTLAGSLTTGREWHSAILLNSGRVLVAGGGSTCTGSCAPVASAEIYDEATGVFSPTGSLNVPRAGQGSVLLNDGSALIVGGNDAADTFTTVEMFASSTQTFIGAGALLAKRTYFTTTLLNDGTVLVVGGIGDTGILATAELFAPPPAPPSSLHITPDVSRILVGDSKQFIVVDELGRQRFDVNWTITDSIIASLTSGNSPTLSALAAGHEILTATVQGVSQQIDITIAPSSLQVTPATVNMQVGDSRQFNVVDHCTAGGGCIGHYEAIYNALDDLIRRLKDPTIVLSVKCDLQRYPNGCTASDLAQINVFNYLGNDKKGHPYTTQRFLSYLNDNRPRFYDGLRSTYCYSSLTDNDHCYTSWYSRWLNGTLVKDKFADIRTDALTGSPSSPFLAFFRPTSIGYASLGKNLGNEGVIFHEALSWDDGAAGLADSG